MTRREAMRYRRHINAVIEPLADEAALDVTDLFEPWKTDTQYAAGDRAKHNDLLYRCVQGHTSQDNWTPDATPALWTRVSVDEWPEWVQPTGAQDAYQKGDKVSHNGKHWICTTYNNTWEPGVYGWEEQDGNS